MNKMFAVIFDMDGTLVDSQPLQYKAYKLAFEKFGSSIKWDDWVKYWIHQSISSCKWIEMNKLEVCGDTIKSIKVEIYNDLIEHELALKPGALKLVDELYSKSIPMAIASTSRYDSIVRIADKFFPYQFTVLQSDVDLGTRKPDPHIFRVTSEKLGIDVTQCIVIEDSLSGYEAAKNANMKVIVCPDSTAGVNKSMFPCADLIVDELGELDFDSISCLLG